MRKPLKQSKMIANAMELALSEQPFAKGKKLAPETQIAEKLKLSRTMIRSAIAILEHKGYLSRKRGSGTFIDKEISSTFFDKNSIYMKIPPEILFSGEEKLLSKAKMKTIGLYSTWTENSVYSPTPDVILNGMLHSAEEKKYRLTVNRVMSGPWKPLSIEEIKERMKHTQCDGVITSYTWKEELEKIYADQKIPKLYYFTQELEVLEDNIVMLASGRAMERAIEILYNEGFTDIACMSYDSKAEISYKSLSRQYECSMHMLGLSYRKFIQKDFSFKSIHKEFSKMQKTSSLPEAFYVADDRLMTIVDEVFEMLNIIPGKDIAIISQANLTPELSLDSRCSTMAFDLNLFGEIIIDCIDKLMKNPDRKLPGQLIMPEWREGISHKKA